MYIYIYKKHNISYRYKGAKVWSFHSLSYTTGAVTVLTLCLSAAMTPAARHCGSTRKSRVHPVIYSVHVSVCAHVLRCGCVGDTF